MKFYFEITLIDGECSLYNLWSALYQQVHIALADMHNKGIKNIGMGFPNYRFLQKNERTFATLGNKLRIFSTSQNILMIFYADLIDRLNKYVKNWEDNLHIKQIKSVPENQKYALFKRHNPNQSKNLIARRMAKKQNVDFESAFDKLTQDNYEPKKSDYPFIQLKSETTKQDFCLYIIKQDISTSELNNYSNEFNAYGLGMVVPDF